jgi:hypothetical protein
MLFRFKKGGILAIKNFIVEYKTFGYTIIIMVNFASNHIQMVVRKLATNS